MGELFQGSSIFALYPRLQHYEGFPLKLIPQDHSVSQHLQRAPSRTLRFASPLLVSTRTTYASTLACRGRTSTMSSLKNSTQREPASSLRPQPPHSSSIQIRTRCYHFSWSQTNSLTTRILEDEYNNEKLKFVWENKIDWVVENSRKLFWKLKENTLEKLSFWYEIYAQKLVEKNSKRDRKNWL